MKKNTENKSISDNGSSEKIEEEKAPMSDSYMSEDDDEFNDLSLNFK